jgi:hypothetical protein
MGHRIIDDARIRNFAEHRQVGYIRAFRKLAAFRGDHLHVASFDDKLALCKSVAQRPPMESTRWIVYC